jgi:pyruvate formate lyase activating enzyme
MIYGFNKSSEAGDNPFAISIFLAGCNMICPYCLNRKLIHKNTDGSNNTDNLVSVPFETIKQYILDNTDTVKMVVISGGEPTLDPLLENLIDAIRDIPCKVGMSTNGMNFEVIERILPKLDFVALDIKTANDRAYRKLFRVPPYFCPSTVVIISLALIRDEKNKRPTLFDYEVRTTLYPNLIDINEIGKRMLPLDGDIRWVLQQYRYPPHVKEFSLVCGLAIHPYSDVQLRQIVKDASRYSKDVRLKYV